MSAAIADVTVSEDAANTVLDLSATFADPHVGRGLVRQDSGDWDGAIREYDEAIRIDPRCVGAYCDRGNVHRLLKDEKAAVRDYTAAIRADPKFVVGYANRGFAYRALGDLKGARSDWEEALRLAPPDWSQRKKIEEALGKLGPEPR